MSLIALAAATHPDDIEFMMAGMLLRLKDSGCEIHLWNLANGCCGSATLSREDAIAVRWEEALASAELAGGTAHPPLFDDLGLYYDAPSVARAAAVIRQIQPDRIACGYFLPGLDSWGRSNASVTRRASWFWRKACIRLRWDTKGRELASAALS